MGKCLRNNNPTKGQKQPKVTNGSSTQRESPAPGGGGLQLALSKYMYFLCGCYKCLLDR